MRKHAPRKLAPNEARRKKVMHEALSACLIDVAEVFSKPEKVKITLVVRQPHLEESDLILTNDDDLDKAIETIRKMRERGI